MCPTIHYIPQIWTRHIISKNIPTYYNMCLKMWPPSWSEGHIGYALDINTSLIDWLTEWYLTSSVNYFIYIQDESMIMISDDEWTLLCTGQTRWAWFKRAISRKQQSAGRHATLSRHMYIILILSSRPAFALTHKCCVLRRELK